MERKWEELEVDCLITVFEKLEIQDLTLGVPFVCKSWYRASLSPHCWKSLNFSKLNFGPCSPFAERFNNEYRIKNFSISGLMKLALNRGRTSVAEIILPGTCTLDTLIYASNQCPCLKILGLPMLISENFVPIFPLDKEMKQLLGLISKWKELEYVHIQDLQFYTEGLLFEISRHCNNFVGIMKTGLMTNEEAKAMANFLPTKLKHLSVTSGFMSEEQLKMILEGCRELEELVVKDCCGFEVNEEILKMTSHIKNFEFEDIRVDVDERYYSTRNRTLFHRDGSELDTIFYPEGLVFDSEISGYVTIMEEGA